MEKNKDAVFSEEGFLSERREIVDPPRGGGRGESASGSEGVRLHTARGRFDSGSGK